MAFAHAFGSLQWLAADAATSTYNVSLPWTPKAMRFWMFGQSSASPTNAFARQDVRTCQGFAVSTSNRRCMGVRSVDNAASSTCALVSNAAAVLAGVTTTGSATAGLLDLTSLSSGFQLTVDEAIDADITVFWEAWTWDGSDAAAIAEFTEPGATGNVDYTTSAAVPVGLVLFGGLQTVVTAPTTAANDSGFLIGAAMPGSSRNQFVYAHNADHSSATMDTDVYIRGDECVAMIVNAGGNPNCRATFVQSNSDGFRLNWLARASTRRFMYMALPASGVTGHVHVGNFTLNRQTAGVKTQVAGLPFAPESIFFTSAGKTEQAAGTAAPVFNPAVAYWSPARSMCIGSHDETGTPNAACFAFVRYDCALYWPENTGFGTTIYQHQVQSVGPDSFTVLMSATDYNIDSNDMHGYIAYGNPVLSVRDGDWPRRVKPGPYKPGPSAWNSWIGAN